MINQIYIVEAKNLLSSWNLLSIVVWHHVKGRSYVETETDNALLRTASLKVLLFHVFMGQNSTQGLLRTLKKNLCIYLDCWCCISIFLHDFQRSKKTKKTHNSAEPTIFTMITTTSTALPMPLFQKQCYNITPQILQQIHETSESHHQHHHHHKYPQNEQKRHPDHHHHDGGASQLLDEALWEVHIPLVPSSPNIWCKGHLSLVGRGASPSRLNHFTTVFSSFTFHRWGSLFSCLIFSTSAKISLYSWSNFRSFSLWDSY